MQQVEEAILKGQLKPGDPLPAERDLAQRFGVSRTAVSGVIGEGLANLLLAGRRDD